MCWTAISVQLTLISCKRIGCTTRRPLYVRCHYITMNPLDAIERLITEHGSAAILSQQLAFAKDQFSVLERQVGEFQAKTAKLEAQLEIERLNHKETQQQLQRLQEEHSEEIRIHKLIEFRRGKRTNGAWMPFCPKCGLPVYDAVVAGGERWAHCSAGCGWFGVELDKDMAAVIAEIKT